MATDIATDLAIDSAVASAFDDIVCLTPPLDTSGLRTRVDHWLNLWQTSENSKIEIRINHRLTRSLGLCRPGKSLIALNSILLEKANEPLLYETLCHELAHWVTHRRYGRHARPHGTEWKLLMLDAGFSPRVQIPGREISGYQRNLQTSKVRTRKRYEYEHYCPVCDAVMTAHRTNYRWRCAPCLNAGLSGDLTVTRRLKPLRSAVA